MKHKGYAKLGGGGGQIRCIMGDVQVAYIRYVVQGMMHPSLFIVENDNAVSISFAVIFIIFRHYSSPLRYEGEEVTYGRFCHIFNSPCWCYATRTRAPPNFLFFSERPVDIGINIAVLTISDIEEENMVSQAPLHGS